MGYIEWLRGFLLYTGRIITILKLDQRKAFRGLNGKKFYFKGLGTIEL